MRAGEPPHCVLIEPFCIKDSCDRITGARLRPEYIDLADGRHGMAGQRPRLGGAPTRHADSVLALRPDATAHPDPWDIGVLGPHGPGSDVAFELRAFFTDGAHLCARIQ